MPLKISYAPYLRIQLPVSFKRRSNTHTDPVGAVCGGRVRIELRPELYAYGAVCVPTQRFSKL